ncbi:MAG: tetratricopeptide repeat protein [Rhodospirillales bacterium]
MPAINSSSPCGLGQIVLLALTLAGCSFGATDRVSGQASIRVAEAALNAGSPRIALQVAQHILDRSPNDMPALLASGDAFTQLGQTDEALEFFERALRLDRSSVRGQIGLGRIRLTTDPTEAANLFRAVLHTEPDNAIALTDLGIALDLLGRHAEAHPYYRQVLMRNPGNVAVQVNLALSLAMTGDTASAIRIVEPLANDRAAPVKLRHNYAAILTMAGRETEAKQLLRQDMPLTQANEALAGYRQGTLLASVRPAPDRVEQIHPIADTQPPTVVAQIETAPTVAIASALQTKAPLPVVHTPSQGEESLIVTQTSAPLDARPERQPIYENALPAMLAPLATTEASHPANDTPRGPRVQLGAFGSEAAANGEWTRLQKRIPGLMAGHDPAITSTERDGKTYWRLRTSGFANQSIASDFCTQVRPKKAKCLVYAS